MDTKDILLGLAGFIASFYGGYKQDLFAVVSGLLLIIFAIYLKLQEHEENIIDLNKQINTQFEIQKIWGEINQLKNEKK